MDLEIHEEETALYDQAIQLFNEGAFDECDGILADLLWQVPGPEKAFFQGLIEVAGAFYHLKEKRYEGFFNLINTGMETLEQYPMHHKDLDLGRFLKQLRDFRMAFGERLATGSSDAKGIEIPKLTYVRQ